MVVLIGKRNNKRNDRMIDIKGLDKADVLASLVNVHRTKDMVLIEMITGSKVIIMTKRQAESRIDAFGLDLDYVQSRAIKTDLSGDELDPRLYDRDAGDGAMARAIDSIRQ